MNLHRSKSSNLRDTSEGSANIRRLLASRAAITDGRRFVVFLPRGAESNDFQAALRKHAGQTDVIDVPTTDSREPIADAERLPLWRWFISSK